MEAGYCFTNKWPPNLVVLNNNLIMLTNSVSRIWQGHSEVNFSLLQIVLKWFGVTHHWGLEEEGQSVHSCGGFFTHMSSAWVVKAGELTQVVQHTSVAYGRADSKWLYFLLGSLSNFQEQVLQKPRWKLYDFLWSRVGIHLAVLYELRQW